MYLCFCAVAILRCSAERKVHQSNRRPRPRVDPPIRAIRRRTRVGLGRNCTHVTARVVTGQTRVEWAKHYR